MGGPRSLPYNIVRQLFRLLNKFNHADIFFCVVLAWYKAKQPFFSFFLRLGEEFNFQDICLYALFQVVS